MSRGTKPWPGTPSKAGRLKKLIDAYNPGVTMLVLLWVAAFEARRVLQQHDALSQIRDEALTSLLFVIPIMLLGWAALAADRALRLGFFSHDD